MNRKTIIAVLIVAFVMGGMAAARIPLTRADSQYLSVVIDNRYPGDAPQYTLTFTLNATVHAGDGLTLTFDSSVGMADGLGVDKALVSVDATTLNTDATWQVGVLSLVSPLDLAVGTDHTIVIQENARIQNPWTLGHYRMTLEHPATKTTLTSNYYLVTTVTQLVPLTFEKAFEYGQMTGVKATFRTGRNGALTGHDLIRGPGGLMVYPDNEDTMTIRLSAGLSALWATAGVVRLQPAYSESPFAMTVLSNTVYDTNDAGIDLRQLVLGLLHNIPANTGMSIYLMFGTGQDISALSSNEYIRIYSSKETALVTIPPQATGSGSGTQPGSPVDTTAPVVTWNVRQSAFSIRLITLNVSITEDNLDEAYFAKDDIDSLRTRLAVGDTGLMMVNRTGIKGMIIATDKAGNTTSVPVDIPAPATS